MADVIGEIIGMKQQPAAASAWGRCGCRLACSDDYESRPQRDHQAASLSIRAAMPASCAAAPEAIDSNRAPPKAGAAEALAGRACRKTRCSWVQTTDREAVGQLIAMPQFVDVIIPRGGKG